MERAHTDAGCVLGNDDLRLDRTLEASHDRAGPREAECSIERTLEGVRRDVYAGLEPYHVVELRAVLERAVADRDERFGEIQRRKRRCARERAVRDHADTVWHGNGRGLQEIYGVSVKEQSWLVLQDQLVLLVLHQY